MKDKLGSLIIDVQGTTLSAEERELIAHPLVAGIIFFARNYESREQLQQLCTQIRSCRTKPLLIMVDQEGGRVQRFVDEFTRLPYLGHFAKTYDQHPEVACSLIKDCAWLMATELLTVGIDLSLSPVVDLHNEISSVIGLRAFHAHPQAVLKMAQAFMQGMNEAGMAATAKHFPGHGSIKLDSHVAMPVDERSLQEIEQSDLIPFAGMAQAGIQAMMAAHIIFPQVDKVAVGFSAYWLKEILAKKLGFKGIIFSDDLNMEGANISTHYEDRVIASQEAGCDFSLLCNNRAAVIQVLDSLPKTMQGPSKEKWGVLTGRFNRVNPSYKESQRWQKTQAFLGKIEESVK